jgi:solute carrier family 25 phosphate transporter 23/24/25/41
MIHGAVAVKFLFAGGIAGAVSRTATAPFDRLKIYLITTARTTATSKALKEGMNAANKVDASAKVASQGFGMLNEAIRTLYREGGGLKAFWIGNGLNCLKIFPESAIKFLSYEMAKRAFAKYVDNVQDSRDISGTSRFMSGGIGGITSQLAIYPVETLKTRLMSSQGGVNRGNALLVATARDMWRNGGMRTYYRGLTAGLIGVFPYSAIDMSTFEGIKLFWIRYTGREEPSVLSLLAFGSISGSVGATTVYPLK